MQEIFDAIKQLGFPIVISAFLLYDYSRKLSELIAEQQKQTIEMVKMAANIHEMKKCLEKLEGRK